MFRDFYQIAKQIVLGAYFLLVGFFFFFRLQNPKKKE